MSSLLGLERKLKAGTGVPLSIWHLYVVSPKFHYYSVLWKCAKYIKNQLWWWTTTYFVKILAQHINVHLHDERCVTMGWSVHTHITHYALSLLVCSQIFTISCVFTDIHNFNLLSLSIYLQKDLMFCCGCICKILGRMF